MYPHFFYPNPQPQQPRPSAAVLPAVGDQPAPPVNQPPFHPVRLRLTRVGGVFYPQYWMLPDSPAGGAAPQVDAPPPRVPLPPQILRSWEKTWNAQRALQFSHPTAAPPAPDQVPFTRPPQAIWSAWSDVVAVELPMPTAPDIAPGDQPRPYKPLPPGIIEAWQKTWPAQRAPRTPQPGGGDTPTPRIPLPDSIIRSWIKAWEAQRSKDTAGWNVPAPAAGDFPPAGVRIPASVLQSWQPAFVMPQRLVALIQERLGDNPTPFVRLPHAVVIAWEKEWEAQHAPPYHAGLVVPPPIAKGMKVVCLSGVYYGVTMLGNQYYLVRIVD